MTDNTITLYGRIESDPAFIERNKEKYLSFLFHHIGENTNFYISVKLPGILAERTTFLKMDQWIIVTGYLQPYGPDSFEIVATQIGIQEKKSH